MSRADHAVVAALRALVAETPHPMVLGICGSQGSGKSTLAAALAREMEADGKACAVLSIDDLYLTRDERRRLAAEVHHLCITRGPPGTHDVPMAIELIDTLRAGRPVPLPRFNKARDDRCDPETWPVAPAHCDVILFEGWCVGAVAQPDEALTEPVNVLEAVEDPDGKWRRWMHDSLSGPYPGLFARIDRLVLLQAPGFEVVMDWRLQQEEELRAAAGEGVGVMERDQIARFIQHYERITRHILGEMPGRADLVIRLDEQRRPVDIVRR